MTTTNYPASLMCDFYKLCHKNQYPDNTEYVFSAWTPRSTYIKGVDKVVSFGLQAFVKQYLIGYFNEHFFSRYKFEVVDEYNRFIKYACGVENPDASHIAALHDLGYLPLEIRSVKEGTLVPLKVPMTTIVNTHPEFFWLTNYIETLFSSQSWIPSTSATIALEYKKIVTKYAEKSGGDLNFIPFQCHDFSLRGMALEAGILSGAGHLTSFVGTDTIPAVLFHELYYNANIEAELVGTSVAATEHSVMSAGGRENEYATYERLINKVHPTGILSIVSDTWDLFGCLENIIRPLKNDIMARDGKVVIRPDSGDPVQILCGHDIVDFTNNKWVTSIEDVESSAKDWISQTVAEETPHGEHGTESESGLFKWNDRYFRVTVEFEWNRYDRQYYFIDGKKVTRFEEFTPSAQQLGVIETLWNIFGGKVNEKGFKELDPHIGAIYGDSITLERCTAICEALMAKGFASTNVVFGIGSFTYQYQTRDTFGFAMKATHIVVDGEERFIQKDPKTDTNKTKKSATGRMVVVQTDKGLALADGLTIQGQAEREIADQLETVFINGRLVRDESLAEIRDRITATI